MAKRARPTTPVPERSKRDAGRSAPKHDRAQQALPTGDELTTWIWYYARGEKDFAALNIACSAAAAEALRKAIHDVAEGKSVVVRNIGLSVPADTTCPLRTGRVPTFCTQVELTRVTKLESRTRVTAVAASCSITFDAEGAKPIDRGLAWTAFGHTDFMTGGPKRAALPERRGLWLWYWNGSVVPQ